MWNPANSCLDDWTSALELGHQVDVIYLDLQKAFDKVPHARLLSKLESYENYYNGLKIFYQIEGNDYVCICIDPKDWINVFSEVPEEMFWIYFCL